MSEFFRPGRHKEQFPKSDTDQNKIEQEREKDHFLKTPIRDAFPIRTSNALRSCFPEEEEPTIEDLLQLKVIATGEVVERKYTIIDKKTGQERTPTLGGIGRKALNDVRDALKPFGLALEIENRE